MNKKFNNGLSIHELEGRYGMYAAGSRDKDTCICGLEIKKK